MHGNKYDLSLAEQPKNTDEKIKIVCHEKDSDGNEHGIFFMTSHALISSKQGCPKCAREKMRLTQDEFMNRVKEAQMGRNYDYTNTKYISSTDNVEVYCNHKDAYGNIHGPFSINATSLMYGHGCPKCNSSILEQKVRSRFIMHNIEYEEQKRFPWLGQQRFDFYIPKLNIAIECQGSQHFIKDSFMSDFEGMVERDERKRRLSSENGVRIIYYVPKKLEEFVKGKYEYFINENDLAIYLSAMLAEIKS